MKIKDVWKLNSRFLIRIGIKETLVKCVHRELLERHKEDIEIFKQDVDFHFDGDKIRAIEILDQDDLYSNCISTSLNYEVIDKTSSNAGYTKENKQ